MKAASHRLIAEEIGRAVKEKLRNNKGWYTPHMAAATRAVIERIPMVDIIMEIRDARIPLSSENDQLMECYSRARRIIVMNKMELAKRSQFQEWTRYFEQRNCISYGVNSHNRDSVKALLNFLQAQVRDMKSSANSTFTTTIMLVGIPNVGKSALANSLHQIGRISAAEKGRLKHAIVNPEPGETKNISSLKIGSHPNIYVLDTPGILPPQIHDAEVCSKLALTGAVQDDLVEEAELARYLLSILNLSDEYKKWAKFSTREDEISLENLKALCLNSSDLDLKQKRQYRTDHTQDFIVREVLRTVLFDTISSFDGNLEDESDMEKLIQVQLPALREAFQISSELCSDKAYDKVAVKLLDLYRTGRLGRYTLDPLPQNGF